MSAKRWTVNDRYGNRIYLTDERWSHIVDSINHPEMLDYEDALKQTIMVGKHRQDPLNPQKFRYVEPFQNLVEDNTHIVAIVLFRYKEDVTGRPELHCDRVSERDRVT